MSIIELILLFAAVGTLMYVVMVHIPKERAKWYKNKLGDIYEVKRILDNLRSDTVIEQVLLWHSFNGGGVAKFGDKLKMSVIDESREQPFRSVYYDFQNIELYGNAIDLMVEMQRMGSTARRTTEMNDGVFRRLFFEENALWFEAFAVGEGNSKDFIFVTIATSSVESPYQLEQGGKIEIAKNALRNKYKRMNSRFGRGFLKQFYTY